MKSKKGIPVRLYYTLQLGELIYGDVKLSYFPVKNRTNFTGEILKNEIEAHIFYKRQFEMFKEILDLSTPHIQLAEEIRKFNDVIALSECLYRIKVKKS